MDHRGTAQPPKATGQGSCPHSPAKTGVYSSVSLQTQAVEDLHHSQSQALGLVSQPYSPRFFTCNILLLQQFKAFLHTGAVGAGFGDEGKKEVKKIVFFPQVKAMTARMSLRR